jgi:hypothetical protein
LSRRRPFVESLIAGFRKIVGHGPNRPTSCASAPPAVSGNPRWAKEFGISRETVYSYLRAKAVTG